MSNTMTNEQIDTALILENNLKRRVEDVMSEIVHKIVKEKVEKELTVRKNELMMEISLSIGKMLQLIEKEGRKPLWECTPEDFNLSKNELNTHMIMKIEE